MKQIPAACVLLAAALPFGHGKSGKNSVEQTLIQMEQDWSQADIKKDAATLNRILAEDWVGIDFEGTVLNKAQALQESRPIRARYSPPYCGTSKFACTAIRQSLPEPTRRRASTTAGTAAASTSGQTCLCSGMAAGRRFHPNPRNSPRPKDRSYSPSFTRPVNGSDHGTGAWWFSGPHPLPSAGAVRIASCRYCLARATAAGSVSPRARPAVIAAE